MLNQEELEVFQRPAATQAHGGFQPCYLLGGDGTRIFFQQFVAVNRIVRPRFIIAFVRFGQVFQAAAGNITHKRF